MMVVYYREEWSRSVLVFVVLLCSCFILVIEANDIRARNNSSAANGDAETTTSTLGTITSTTTTTSLLLQDIWARETAAAQAELHRFLNGQYRFDAAFSMPAGDKPNDNPTVAPKPSPTTSIRPTGGPAQPTATFAPQTMRPTPPNGSCLTGRTPEQYLLDEMLKLSDVNQLLDPDFPQGMAFNFILADPAIRQDVCGYPTLGQRYGLATLYYSTAGSDWTQKSEWVSSSGECTWFGVQCVDGRITRIELDENNLVGTLPNEIATLHEVTSVQLFTNNITGTIPAGFTNLTKLELLDLERNQLTGSAFPTSILTLDSLKQYFVSNNQLTGSIPEDLGVRLMSITDLWAANNKLVGPIPSSIGDMTNLQTLIMYGNALAGVLPTSIGELTGLTNLQLYRNIFDQPLPGSLFGLTNLAVLRLDQNFFTGTIPTTVGQLTALTDFRIHNNFFESKLPDDLISLNKLRIFTAGTNLFTGTIPNVFAAFQQLQDIDLSTSFFTGPLPDSIFDNDSIERVYLNNNALEGSLPASMANSPALIDLFVDNNVLTGSIPEASSLPKLNEFLVQNNLFTGTMPQSICTLRSTGTLVNLFSDCGGATPEVECRFPSCCNRCFEGGQVTDQRTLLLQQDFLSKIDDRRWNREHHTVTLTGETTSSP